MKAFAASLIVCLGALIFVFSGSSEADKAGEIRRLEVKRFEAMTKADESVLNELLADDLTYTHSTGKTENKAQFIAGLKSGAAKYKEIVPSEMQVRVFGDTAVVNGVAQVKVEANNQEINFKAKFLDVYARQKGKWRLVAWQSTRINE